ncbi:MAG: PAS domain-containing protein [Candidatus Latescibacteria bacterium]|nr:PAS domain-containing protein [Candidatus Latescibacterota bacterium]
MSLSLRRYIELNLIVTLSVVLFVATEAYLYIKRVNEEYRIASQAELSTLQTLQALQRLLWRAEKAERNFLTTRKKEYAEQTQESIVEFEKRITDWEDNQTRDELLKSARQYNQLLVTMVGNIERGRTTQGRQISLQLSELREEIRKTIAAAFESKMIDLLSRIQASRGMAAKTVRTIWVGSLLVLIGTLFFSVVLARKVARPVQQISDVLQKALDGDLSQRTELKPGDEIRELGQSLDRLLVQMKTFDQLKVQKITEEKEKLEALLDILPEGVIIVDSEGRINLINNSCLRFFGLSMDSAVEKPLSEVAAIDKQLRDLVTETFTGRKKIADREVKISVGLERPAQKTVLVNTAMVHRSDGEVSYVVVSLKEISKGEKVGLKRKIKDALGKK